MIHTHAGRTSTILALLFALFAISPVAGAGKSPITVPEGTALMSLKYGEEGTEAQLKPEEQVAFLLVYSLWGLEGDCFSESGVGRLCTIDELAKGVKTQGGEIIGLNVNPRLDTNYLYDIIIVGGNCIIRALPRIAGLGAFGLAGSAQRSAGTFYYNPKGADLTRGTVEFTEYGFEGKGFRR
jgi:hypothetical protein